MPAVVSPVAGTRVEPIDGYTFIRGTTATFKVIFLDNGVPTTVDVGTDPVARILEPNFLAEGNNPVPNVIATLTGTLVPGQQFEYEFVWNIPSNQVPIDNYIVSYEATIGSILNNFGDEFFAIKASAGQISIKTPSYATVDDVRKRKFNIDDYLPAATRADLTARNNLIEAHLRDATTKLREELNLSKSRGYSENYRLFATTYAIWSILLAARGEDGSSISDQNLTTWRGEWERILKQEKRESQVQGVPLGRG